MPYLWNETQGGSVTSTPVYVTVYFEDDDGDNWEEEYRLNIDVRGKVVSDKALEGEAYSVNDWDGYEAEGLPSSTPDGGSDFSDQFTVLYTKRELDQMVAARQAVTADDPLAELLREVTR